MLHCASGSRAFTSACPSGAGLIADLYGRGGDDGALDEARGLEFLQALGEQPVGDAVDHRPVLAEAPGALGGSLQYRPRRAPGAAHHGRRPHRRFRRPGHPHRRAGRGLRRRLKLIEELEHADAILIGAPMYNFTIPSTLKAWLDNVILIGRTAMAEDS